MKKMTFDEILAQKAGEMEDVIKRFLPDAKGYQKTVLEAMNYAVNAGGKRLRPMLMAETASLFGGARSQLLEPFMAAIEMIHTYSLIHDDLPALDNDDYRRGRLTTHKVYGEAMAILAGDGLLNYAYETASRALMAAEGSELKKVATAMAILSQKPGIYGMIGGQVVDVEESGRPLTRDVLNFIYTNKTSALIECAMMIGAVLAGADNDQVQCVESAADAIGIAFQIQDDILDVEGSQEDLGKPVGSDAKNEKTTYVTLEGMDKAKNQVRQLSLDALKMLETVGLSEKNPFLKDLVVWLIHRKK